MRSYYNFSPKIMTFIKYRHKKSGFVYTRIIPHSYKIIDCTNNNNDQEMVLYTRNGHVFVREEKEFMEKFEVLEEQSGINF